MIDAARVGSPVPVSPPVESQVPAAPVSAAPARLGTFHSLRDPAFAWFFISTLGMMGAVMMQMLVRGFLVFELTGSFTALGLLSLASALPQLVFGFYGGVLADRFPKKNRHPGWPGHRVRERPGNGITRIVRFVGVLASSGQRRRFGAPGGHDDARASGNGVRSRQGRANDERHLAQFRRHEHDADHRAGGGWPRASGLGSGRCILRDGGELRRRDPHHVISARGAGDAEERRDRERSGS